MDGSERTSFPDRSGGCDISCGLYFVNNHADLSECISFASGKKAAKDAPKQPSGKQAVSLDVNLFVGIFSVRPGTVIAADKDNDLNIIRLRNAI